MVMSERFDALHYRLDNILKRFGPKSYRQITGQRSAVRDVSGYRCVSDSRYRDPEFDPGLVQYFRGD